jgi:hypothetical protein
LALKFSLDLSKSNKTFQTYLSHKQLYSINLLLLQQFLRCGDAAVFDHTQIDFELIRQNQIHSEFISKSNLKTNWYRIRTNFIELIPNSYLFTELVPNSYLFTELGPYSN